MAAGEYWPPEYWPPPMVTTAAAATGWACPVCGHVMAPFMASCSWCPGKPAPLPAGRGDRVFGEFTQVPSPGTGDLLLRIPAQMAVPHSSRRLLLTGPSWQDVIPGLQVRMRSDLAQVDLEFRVTPEPSSGQ
jgi:hypothetical protein